MNNGIYFINQNNLYLIVKANNINNIININGSL
jgi:hypothetical protein